MRRLTPALLPLLLTAVGADYRNPLRDPTAPGYRDPELASPSAGAAAGTWHTLLRRVRTLPLGSKAALAGGSLVVTSRALVPSTGQLIVS